MVFLRVIFSIFVVQLFVVGTQAAVLDRLTVGSDDTYLFLCPDLPPSDANEVACFGSAGVSTTVPQLVKSGNNFVELTDAAGVYALALPSGAQSSHFLVKTGNIGGEDKQYSFIFTNNSETAYAVFNLTLFQALLANILPDVDGFDGIGKISHVSSFTSAVPLPAAVWMMITALGGMFGFRKLGLRRRKAA